MISRSELQEKLDDIFGGDGCFIEGQIYENVYLHLWKGTFSDLVQILKLFKSNEFEFETNYLHDAPYLELRIHTSLKIDWYK